MKSNYVRAGISCLALVVGACSANIIDPIGGGPGGSAGSSGVGGNGHGGAPSKGGAPGVENALECGTQRIVYKAPGCGDAAVPSCEGASRACSTAVCGCDGKIRTDGCNNSTAPFAYFTNVFSGSCDPNGVVSESAQGGDGGQAGDGGSGGLQCGGSRVVYKAPGCGDAAVPSCEGGAGACSTGVCGCDGKVRADGCYSSSAPFAYFVPASGGTCDPVINYGGQGGTAGGPIGAAGGPLGTAGAAVRGGAGGVGGELPIDGNFPYAGAGGAMPDVALGATVYYKQCASCHGTNAQGNQCPNITPSKTAGIGAWTYQQFHDAVRLGEGPNGSSLCFLMTPFTQSDVSEFEMLGLYAFLNIVAPSDVPNRGTYCP